MRRFRPALSIVIAATIFFGISGCVPLIIGGAAGALGAYAISKDTIQGDTDKSYDQLWSSAMTVARSRGLIKEEDAVRGYLEFQEDASRVTIKLVQVTRSAVRLKVACRKHHLPDINAAQDVFVKIIEGAR